MVQLAYPALVGDIGGTNARFSYLADPAGEPHHLGAVKTAEHPTLADALDRAILPAAPEPARTFVLAFAAPLFGETFALTNCDWHIEPAALIDRYGLEGIELMNDFAAQAIGALTLDENELVRVGGGEHIHPGNIIVMGPGTGLGVATVIDVGGRQTIVTGEGGHTDLGPQSDREFELWPHLDKKEGRMIAELVLSGRGLENVCRAIRRCDGQEEKPLKAADIAGEAIAGTDPVAREAVEVFCTVLGRVAGNLALTTMARGGVYICGGVAHALLPLVTDGGFRAAFEDKAPYRDLMASIATSVVARRDSSLAGLVRHVQAPDRFDLTLAARRFER